MRYASLFWLMMLAGYSGWTQELEKDTVITTEPLDTTFIKSDAQVVPIESYAKRFSPRKALLYSAVLPGSGQIYNKKYWKVPLVYGGFGVLLYVTHFYHQSYTTYRQEFFMLINDPDNPPVSASGFTEDQLRTLINRSRRERDFFLAMTGFFYMLQMVDAHVDAHLKEFDLNPKMQVRIEPLMENSMMLGRSTGVALKIRF